MAKQVEVLLTKPVFKLGTMGEIVSVKPGYARNYLLPHGLAVPASSAAKRQVEVLQEQARKLAVEHEAQALVVKNQIAGLAVSIAAKVAHDDVLFGSVGARDIVAAVAEAKGVKLDAHQVKLHENFKKTGSYPVVLELFSTVDVEITVNVVSDNPEGPGLDEELAAERSEAPAEA
ncbi:MAG: 50S ribosomal protein L9 [Planctomycetota bacterium]|jgi:large subunit ribosomal protein L9